MAIHFLRDLEGLKRELLLVGALVEEATRNAILTVVDGRRELAADVIRGDLEIDRREVHLEEECLKVLALHQPVANDLRFVLAVLKVNSDLERVGDLAENIAERGLDLAEFTPVRVPIEIRTMAARVLTMLHESLSSVVEADTTLARDVLAADQEVDDLHRRTFSILLQRIQKNPDHAEIQIQLLSVSRNLERIADMATNIAEDVVFMVEGDVIRHQPEPQA